MSDDYLDAETRRRFALQEPLSAAADTIYDAADEGEAQGYTGIVLDVEGGHVHVYWYGTAPAAVISAITATRENVRVSLHATPHSLRAHLEQDVRQILDDEERRTVPDEYRAHGLAVQADGSGIVVYVEQLDPDEQRRRALRHVIATEIAGRSRFT